MKGLPFLKYPVFRNMRWMNKRLILERSINQSKSAMSISAKGQLSSRLLWWLGPSVVRGHQWGELQSQAPRSKTQTISQNLSSSRNSQAIIHELITIIQQNIEWNQFILNLTASYIKQVTCFLCISFYCCAQNGIISRVWTKRPRSS